MKKMPSFNDAVRNFSGNREIPTPKTPTAVPSVENPTPETPNLVTITAETAEFVKDLAYQKLQSYGYHINTNDSGEISISHPRSKQIYTGTESELSLDAIRIMCENSDYLERSLEVLETSEHFGLFLQEYSYPMPDSLDAIIKVRDSHKKHFLTMTANEKSLDGLCRLTVDYIYKDILTFKQKDEIETVAKIKLLFADSTFSYAEKDNPTRIKQTFHYTKGDIDRFLTEAEELAKKSA